MAVHPNIAALNECLAASRHTGVATFLRHMLAIHPPDRLPPRSAFDPLDVPGLLSSIILVAVARRPDGAPRFRVKVAGEDILNASPFPLMGRFLDEATLATGEGRIFVDVRQEVLDTGRSYYWYGPPRMKFRFDYAYLEYVHCPLSQDGATIDHIISIFHYEGKRH